MNDRDIEKCERAAQIFLLTLFTLIVTFVAVTFGFAMALVTVSFKILKSFIALATALVDEIIIRKEVAKWHMMEKQNTGTKTSTGKVFQFATHGQYHQRYS